MNCLKKLFREWDRFAKAEYERLAMEEENGEDSEMLDAMEGWDSDQDDQQNRDPNNQANPQATAAAGEGGTQQPGGAAARQGTAGAASTATRTGGINAD